MNLLLLIDIFKLDLLDFNFQISVANVATTKQTTIHESELLGGSIVSNRR